MITNNTTKTEAIEFALNQVGQRQIVKGAYDNTATIGVSFNVSLGRNDIKSLKVNDRVRSLDTKTIDDIAQSFIVNGVLNPLTVKRGANVNDHATYKLIAGLHRWEAIKQLWKEFPDINLKMPCKVIDIADADIGLIEIVENLHRKELSASERSVLGARYLKESIRKSNCKSNSVVDTNQIGDTNQPSDTNQPKPKSGARKGWFSVWYEEVGLSKKSADRLWTAFKKHKGIATTPAKSESYKEEFAEFVITRDEDEKAKKELLEQGKVEEAKAYAIESAKIAFEKVLTGLFESAGVAIEGGMTKAEVIKELTVTMGSIEVSYDEGA